MNDVDYDEEKENVPISEPPQRSVLMIEFENQSSTNFTFQAVGIGAFQLLFLSKYFDILGRNALTQEAQIQTQRRLEEEARKKILTPEDVRKTMTL